PWSLRSPKRSGFATFNSGFACAPLACPSALRLRGSDETSPTGSEMLVRTTSTKQVEQQKQKNEFS
ncbi:hypothetical protein KBX54_14585, partial [Lacticaseibacillus paracasei]|nr:hypothetical protein [Lacticaseibacillus paracasei]